MGTEMSINGQIAPRGRTTIIRVPVLTDLDGNEIALTIHAVVGAKPGPTLAMHTVARSWAWRRVEPALTNARASASRQLRKISPETVRSSSVASDPTHDAATAHPRS